MRAFNPGESGKKYLKCTSRVIDQGAEASIMVRAVRITYLSIIPAAKDLLIRQRVRMFARDRDRIDQCECLDRLP
jgi:hypothetical protein